MDKKDVMISKVPKTIKKLDGFISHMNRLMHTRENHDAVILFLAFATHFVATALETPVPERLKQWATRFSTICLRRIPTRLSSVALFSKLSAHIARFRASRPVLAERARALSDIMDDWQIITRLWGMLGIWTDGKEFLAGLIRTKDGSDEFDEHPRDYLISKAIKATYVLGLFSYLGSENLAWLTRRGVLRKSEKSESRLMIWSLKGWGIYVFSELAQLLHDRSLTNRGLREEDEDSKGEWRRKLVQMLLYAPLTFHWIKGGELFPETLASFLAAYTEYITVKELWRASA